MKNAGEHMLGKHFHGTKSRNDQLFADLMMSYHNELYRTAWRYLKNEHDALDALQEVGYRAFRNFHKVKNPQYVKTWMIRIMINYCLDEMKRRKRVVPVGSLSEETDQNCDCAVSLDIERYVQSLDEKYQLIIVLKYYHQYTLSEIAENLEIPLGTVKTRLNHSLELLRNQMQKEEDNDD